MDSLLRCVFSLLIVSSVFWTNSKAEFAGSVFFLDSPTHQYLRTQSLEDDIKSHSMLLLEAGAAVSVLLGSAPPATLSASGSSKLNEVLLPNPFDRPRAVFTLEVAGIDDHELLADLDNGLFRNAFRSKIAISAAKADINLSDEDEVFVVSLDEGIADCTEKEISDFASWLRGLYVVDALEPLSGKLSIPLGDGSNLNLDMAKSADREFFLSLLSLNRNIRYAMDMHKDLSQSTSRPAELMTGRFDIKAMRENYGPKSVVQPMELLVATISKLFNLLQTAYEGEIVGIILFDGRYPPESERMLNVKSISQSSPRWLAEAEGSSNVTHASEVMLVRRTLAWLTGVILLVSTLIGIYFLLNMPLTKDTLLYSNVKLD